MKKLVVLCELILLINIYSCKKKETTPEPTNSIPTSEVEIPYGLIQSHNLDYCNLYTKYLFKDSAGTITKDSAIQASIYAGPTGYSTPTNVFGGTVTLNGTTIPYYNVPIPIYYINSSSPVNISSSMTWSVSGSGTVTAFSQSFTPSYPKYTGGYLLPSNCIKANGITLNITGITNNLNGFVVYLNKETDNLYKGVLGSSGTVVFTPSEIANLPNNSLITIDLTLTNGYSATHNGFKHGFINSIQYRKYCYLN